MEYVLTNSFSDNLKILRLVAAIVYPGDEIRQNLCLAQAILESSLLSAPSGLAKPPNNNLFGIKGKGTDGTVYLQTHEYVKGKEIIARAGFAKNESLIDSVRQHRHILELDRYKSVWEAPTFEDAANQIRLDGYATDPNYSKSLTSIYNKYLK